MIDRHFVVFAISTCFLITNFMGMGFSFRRVYQRRKEGRTRRLVEAFLFNKELGTVEFSQLRPEVGVSKSIEEKLIQKNSRSYKTKQIVNDLKTLCKEQGIEVHFAQKSARHQGLIFFDEKTGTSISLTIGNYDEISPGAQRSLLSYFADMNRGNRNQEAVSAVGNLSDTVFFVLETLFSKIPESV